MAKSLMDVVERFDRNADAFISITNKKTHTGIKHIGKDFKLVFRKNELAFVTKPTTVVMYDEIGREYLKLLNDFVLRFSKSGDKVIATPTKKFKLIVLELETGGKLLSSDADNNYVAVTVNTKVADYEVCHSNPRTLYEMALELAKFTGLPKPPKELIEGLIVSRVKKGEIKPPFVVKEYVEKGRHTRGELVIACNKNGKEEGISFAIKNGEVVIPDHIKFLMKKK